MQSLSEKIVQGILLEVNCIVGEEKWKKLIEFVESELAVEQERGADSLKDSAFGDNLELIRSAQLLNNSGSR